MAYQGHGDYGATQGYDNYGDGYNYGNDGVAYGNERQQPHTGQYGPRPGRSGGPMPPYGRGGPVARPATANGHRGGPQPSRGAGTGRGMPSRGRGGGWPGQHPPPGNYGGQRPSPNHPDAGYGAYEQDQQLTAQMAGMDINGQQPRGPANGYQLSRSQEDYGRPVNSGVRGHPGYGDPRQGSAAGQATANGYPAYNEGYGAEPPKPMRNEPSQPNMSMTMPNHDPSFAYNMPPPRRVGTMAFNGVAGSDGVPPRPSTAGGHRPPPQRMYAPNDQAAAQQQYANGYNDKGFGQVPGPDPTGSVDDFFDSYYDPRTSGNGQQQDAYGKQDFAPTSGHDARRSYERPARPGVEQPLSGAHGMPRLHHAKSEANFHKPQAAVFEMVGDIPSMPPPLQSQPLQPGYNQGYGAAPAVYEQLPPRGPSAPPGPVREARLPGGHGQQMGPPLSASPDSLPSHPAPVRPGLMPGSVVNLKDRPPPVRNYGGAMQPQPQQQQYAHSMSPPHPQQQLQRPPPARVGYQPPEAGQVEEPVSAQQLERLRMAIKNNSNDQESALSLAKKLIEAADVLAPKLPDPKGRSRARERYLVDAHKVLKKLSNAQNQEAMFILADSLGKGLFGNEPDNKEAFTLYQSAAKLGHAAAAYRTAVCCEIGHEDGGGTRRDPLKAMQWYKRAATLGDPPAMYKVGMILLKGLLGQQRNPREAVGWLKRAAERADAENPHALHELGLLYESAQPNDAIIRDEPYALSLFQEAANLGYKFSQYRLGLAFEQGQLGVMQDHRQSIFWYSRAAEQGEHQSELALSGWYLTGSPNVLNQNDTEAYLWARKAAVAGMAKAEYAMGYFTEVGIGTAANLEDAKRWYWRAAAQDFPKARERLEELKRVGKGGGARPRERISRSRIEKQQQDGDCTVM
ncbi:Tetratricopeptide-like helical [Moelleriella libera RCEF 2490]|uniref:Tetratricopeptide-like helical n=1 Tax=Moelleriella libera RCEF 2490 TaxID=1081109 RepID=A0A167XV25_9HYPO|nr:Tetratricopeptide-like helical [Moelleriella libera RCEF 2490]